MRILMLTEYFTPYDFGGSEWSTYYLAKGLVKKKFDITILTPNYGKSPESQIIQGIKIVRFPFYKKLKTKKELTPFWHTNTLWVLWTILFVIKYCLRNKVDIIHVQGKYFLPSAIITKLLLQKKVLITLRDYIILCPLGMCLLRGNKGCDIVEYLLRDIRQYINTYKKSESLIQKLILSLFAIRGRFISYWLRFLLNFVDAKVALSKKERTIFLKSGFQNIKVIGNAFDLPQKSSLGKAIGVIYAGRLTPGKGADLLIKAIPSILKKHPDENFIFFGRGFLKFDLLRQAKKLGISSRVVFKDYIDHRKFTSQLSNYKLAVIPSRWPEPFGRIVIESLASNVPVVISDHVGASDFVVDKRWGRIVGPSEQEIASGINFALENFGKLRANIFSDRGKIKNLLTDNIYGLYSMIYKNLTK